jgi:hypothetical protein
MGLLIPFHKFLCNFERIYIIFFSNYKKVLIMLQHANRTYRSALIINVFINSMVEF